MQLKTVKKYSGLLGVLGFVCAIAVTASLSAVVIAAQSDGEISSHLVNIISDGQSWQYISTSPTVGATLRESGVILGPKDITYPARSKRLYPNMTIRVVRVTQQTITYTEPIAYKTETKFNMYGSAGRTVLQEGQRGEKEITKTITYRDGIAHQSKIVSAKVTKKPVMKVVSITKEALLASRSGMNIKSIKMAATAYDPGPRSCGPYANGRTATGMKAGKGVVAVDPRFIKLGTKLYVVGYGYCIAGDTGGAIKGNRIDLGFNTYREAVQFGRRTVTVFILN
ncbi:MAG: 3D domain-containing protein [Armatimonadota bacterium]|nr:hypothetical protein [Armatimonadota bacterium]